MNSEIKVGDWFDRWEVIGETRKNGKRYIRCRCKCGAEADVYYRSLLTGRSKSCGCLRSDQKRENAEDLTGKTFGRLKVIGRDSADRNKWVCECRCGNIVSVARGSLVSRSTQSCGCIQKEIASGVGGKTIGKNSAAQIARNREWNTNFQVIGNDGLPRNNTSGHKGVSWDAKRERWSAYIQVHGSRVFLGRYKKYEDAVGVRKEAEERYFEPLLNAVKENKDGKI